MGDHDGRPSDGPAPVHSPLSLISWMVIWRTTMTDVLYNLMLLGGEMVILASGLRRARWMWLAATQPLLAALLARAFGEDIFGAMRLLSHGVFLHGPPFAIVVGARLRAVSRAFPRVGVVAALVLLGVGVDAFWIEPRALQVTRVHIDSAKLTRRVRIAVLADLQMRVFGDYERAALRRALELKPDLMLFAGDYVQAPGVQRQRAVDGLGQYLASIRFSAPLGVHAVRGNVDRPGWAASFEPIAATTYAQTETVTRGDVQITGLALRDSFDTRLRVRGSPRFHIAFGHAPDFALGEVDADLLIAGHTHGGQVRLPGWGPLLTFSHVPRAWAAGVTQLGGARTLIVSKGIGLERGYAPEVRFLCRPEIVLLEVSPAPRSNSQVPAGATGGSPGSVYGER